MSSRFITGSKVLSGYGTVITWRVGLNRMPVICIMEAGCTDDGVHTPAQSVDVVGVDALLRLKEAIDEVLAEETAAKLKA